MAGPEGEGKEEKLKFMLDQIIIEVVGPTPLYTCFPAPNSTPCSGETSLAHRTATALILRQRARITAQHDISINCAAAAALVAEVNVWWATGGVGGREAEGTSRESSEPRHSIGALP
jgi:hypothetical protein